jgi:hypothetical protein
MMPNRTFANVRHNDRRLLTELSLNRFPTGKRCLRLSLSRSRSRSRSHTQRASTRSPNPSRNQSRCLKLSWSTISGAAMNPSSPQSCGAEDGDMAGRLLRLTVMRPQRGRQRRGGGWPRLLGWASPLRLQRRRTRRDGAWNRPRMGLGSIAIRGTFGGRRRGLRGRVSDGHLVMLVWVQGDEGQCQTERRLVMSVWYIVISPWMVC